mgnify:CR=1 FL=1
MIMIRVNQSKLRYYLYIYIHIVDVVIIDEMFIPQRVSRLRFLYI